MLGMAIDICIRGAGVVGMTLALLLARARIRVGLVRSAPVGLPTQPGHLAQAAQNDTRDTRDTRDIRAFALNAASRATLASLRAWPEQASPVLHMRVHGDTALAGAEAADVAGDRAENVAESMAESAVASKAGFTGAGRFANPSRHTSASVVHFDASAMGADALAWIVDASVLEQRLRDALSFAPEVTWLDAPHSAALTVICEGRSSASRAAAGLSFTQTPDGPTAIAATLDTDAPHQSTAWQWMQGAGTDGAEVAGGAEDTAGKAAGGVCALLPRAGNSVALVWSVDHAHAQHLLALDEAEFCRQLQAACGNALGAMRLTSQRAAWPLHMAQASRWVGVGLDVDTISQATPQPMPQATWALAGDAAHAVHPLAGQGLNLGLADVAALAHILSTKAYFRSYGDMRLLRSYERARSGDAAALRLATDGLQRLFASSDPRVRTLRNWGLRGFDALGPLKTRVMRQAMGV